MAELYRMSVFRPAGRKFYVSQWTDPVSGKLKTKSTKCRLKKDADRFAGDLAAQLREGRFQDACRVTWSDFRDRFDAEYSPSRAPKTARGYDDAFASLERFIGPKLLSSVDTSTVSKFQAKMRSAGLAEATIAKNLRHLKAAMRWAKRLGVLQKVPQFDMPKGVAKAKGRPITAEEFDRLVAKIRDRRVFKVKAETSATIARGDQTVASWEYLMRGLWLSGLRLGEAMKLHWSNDDEILVDLTGKRPLLRIQAGAQKSRRFELLPITPDFAAFLLETPETDRRGYVFDPMAKKKFFERMTLDAVTHAISDLGEAAKVVVATNAKGKTKYASAHDLRRSFGFRWSAKVRPATLQAMM